MARRPDSKFKFGEWLPDQADLDNTGLIECNNARPIDGSYSAYPPLLGSGVTVESGALVRGARRCIIANGNSFVFVGTNLHLYYANGAGAGAWTNVTPLAGLNNNGSPRIFGQYNNYLFCAQAQENPLYLDSNGGANFAQLTGAFGAAPKAGTLGILNQFVMVGYLGSGATQEPNAVQWCGINQPLNWPTPASSDAIAQQSGKQYADITLGAVRGIGQGDQWGVILMNGGLVRATYQGGDTVFGFDTIYRGPGALGFNAWVKVGGIYFAMTVAGFIATDGAQVFNIGRGKVDKYFIKNADFSAADNFRCGVDWVNRLVLFAWPRLGNGGIANDVLIYSIDEKRWAHAADAVACFVLGEEGGQLVGAVQLEAFDSSAKCGLFNGTPGTSTIITGEVELNPGGSTLVSGIRPQISGTTRDKITVSDGARDDQTDETPVVYTTGSAIDAFTGQSDFIVDARYHRAKFEIQGAYTKAIGGEFDAQPTSNG